MNGEIAVDQLAMISTRWSLVDRAHGEHDEIAHSARQQLLERYGGAVRRYLRKVLADAHAADDVFQEFALRVVRGDLRGADPERGRFRNFVKGTLFHLIGDYRKNERRWPQGLPAGSVAQSGDDEDAHFDRQFLESWRDELLAHAWAALAQSDARNGQTYYEVLRFRAEHPEMRSPEMGRKLTAALGKPFTAAAVRQTLHRARERFADLLLEEVGRSLESPPLDRLEQELVDIGLIDYCRPAIDRCAAHV